MISANVCVAALLPLVYLLVLVPVSTVPVGNVPSPIKNIPNMEAFNFMKRFGYLEEGNGDLEAIYSKEAVIDAIKNVQKFGAIPQTGVIDNATLELFQTPRCGVSDVLRNQRPKRFTVGSKGWKKRRLTYYIENWSPQLGERKVSKNIQRALDTWGKYGKLTFTRVNDPSADIIVSFKTGDHGDHFPFDGPGNILAHAFFPNDGDIHFDSDEHWNTFDGDESKQGTDFFTVAVHELGHSLGLAHSPVPTAIMFPYYTGYKAQVTLDYDDILGMYELYIRGLPEIPYEPDTTTESQNGPEETTPKRLYPEDPFDGDIDGIDQPPVVPEYTTTTTLRPAKRPPRPKLPPIPDICEGNFDSVALLRNELFVFKNNYIWRLRDRNTITPGYPVLIRQMFPKLPDSIKKVDAAYERPDGMIVLFTGNHYWVTNGNEMLENSPQPLTNYGLPANLDRLDAAQLWKRNGKTYLYKDDHFWRYNDEARAMDPGYPKSMNKWRGVPNNLDAVVTWKDGYTYFFKGAHYWKFDNEWIAVTDSSPMPAPQTWLGCPEGQYLRDYYSSS